MDTPPWDRHRAPLNVLRVRTFRTKSHERCLVAMAPRFPCVWEASGGIALRMARDIRAPAVDMGFITDEVKQNRSRIQFI